jgi:hypothetical protein
MAALGAVAAPAMAAQIVLVQSAHAQTGAPAALPPPPYANAVGRQTPTYGGPQAYDRYGGGTNHARVQAANAPSPTYSGPRLGWAGKTDADSNSHPTRSFGPPSPSRGGTTNTDPPPPAPQGWTYVPPIGRRPVEPPAPPTSIYDSPPPPIQSAAAPQGDGPRHYSLHREFGIAPDPIPPPGTGTAVAVAADPLPTDFFAATPDLSQPETADPAKKVTTANGKARNPVQPADGQ